MKKPPIPVFVLLACILSTLAVLAVAGVFAGRGEAASDPSPLASVPGQPVPTPTPEPALTPAEFEEFVESLCNNSQVWHVGWEQPEDDRLRLVWEVDKYQGPHVGPPYEGYKLAFRVERIAEQKLVEWDYDSAPWNLVADVTNDHSWEGPAESGEWIYRVVAFSVTLQGQTMQCPELLWVETYVSVVLPPTAEELAKLARTLCEDLEVIELEGGGEWDEAWLYWDTNASDLPELPESDSNYLAPFYDEIGVSFQVQRRSENSVIWRSEEHLEVAPLWQGGSYWEGPAAPGKSVYRVAVSSISFMEQTFSCKAPLQYSETDVETPTEEERAEIQGEREVLIGEMTRCTKEALTRNISEEALPVIGKYVELLIEEEIGGDYGLEANSELAYSAAMMCSLGSDEGAGSWALLTLFGFGF